MLLVALASIQLVYFSLAPVETTSALAAACMRQDRVVIEVTANQVKCEIPMTSTQKVNIMFLRFQQRRMDGDVRRLVGYTVIPNATGSTVQARVWDEADIRGNTRTSDAIDQRILDMLRMDMLDAGGKLRQPAP